MAIVTVRRGAIIVVVRIRLLTFRTILTLFPWVLLWALVLLMPTGDRRRRMEMGLRIEAHAFD
jgi:hypothetical protein